MSFKTFDSPQDAAMVGFPARYCRVVASCVEGDDAYVLLWSSGAKPREVQTWFAPGSKVWWSRSQ